MRLIPLVMKVIVDNNRAALQDPIGTRVVCSQHQYLFLVVEDNTFWCLCFFPSGVGGSSNNTTLPQSQWVFSERTYFHLENQRVIGGFHSQCKSIIHHSSTPFPASVPRRPCNLLKFPFRFLGFFAPLPFWIIWKLSKPESTLAKTMKYINVPILTLYIGWSVFLSFFFVVFEFISDCYFWQVTILR